MSHPGIDSISAALASQPRPATALREAQATVDSFESRIATFYPYAQPPADPQPRAASAADARQRSGAVGAPGAPQRRHSRRGDA